MLMPATAPGLIAIVDPASMPECRCLMSVSKTDNASLCRAFKLPYLQCSAFGGKDPEVGLTPLSINT